MNALNARTSTSRPLEALGIDEMQERIYRVLLAHRMATTEDIAKMLSLSPRKTQRLLDGIESKGLATHSPEHPRRYIAAPPELAVEALASQRRADIERACSTIPELKKEATSSADNQGNEQVVEIITSRAALGQIVTHLHQTVQSEVFGFQSGPSLNPDSHQQGQRPGVRIRSISDMAHLEAPGSMNSLRRVMQLGEEARVFPTLPVTMFVADRRIGLILNAKNPASGPTLLVRACPLLDALCAFFELIWERATPITFTQTGKLEAGKPNSQLTEATELLLLLLAAGLNDKAIAHEAGISDTTLTRRISELMKCFDTRTRFQLGWRAALNAFPKDLTVGTATKPPPASR